MRINRSKAPMYTESWSISPVALDRCQKRIQVDNGSEFISKALDQWAYGHGVTLVFSRPGKPTDNPYIESFNGSLRDECLNLHWFLLLDDARQKIEAWRSEYNGFRPHGSLGDLTPNEYLDQHQITPDSLLMTGI